LWHLGLEEEGDVAVEDSDCVRRSLGEDGASEGAKRGLEGGQISGSNVEGSVIVSNKEIEHGVTRTRCHSFYKLIDERRDGSVADGDSVEGLEVVHNAKGAVLLFDAEPAGPVRGVGGLVNTSGDFLFEQVDDVVHDAGRDRNVSLDPGRVCDGRDFYWGEVVVPEASALGFSPGEGCLVEFEDVLGELEFFWPEEFVPVEFEVV
jgi:hypothetical protein